MDQASDAGDDAEHQLAETVDLQTDVDLQPLNREPSDAQGRFTAIDD